jgi:threonine/homoserine/homoserine lactone efflux protein
MDSALLASLLGFALLTSITPGPNNLLLMSSGAVFGWRRTLPHLVGVQVGFAILVASAVFGLGGLVERWPGLVTGVKVAGAVWLCWMAWRFMPASTSTSTSTSTSATADASPAGEPSESCGIEAISRPFRFHEAVLFQWINPKAMLLALSGAAAYVGIAEEPGQRLLIIGGSFLLSGTIASTTWTTAGEIVHRAMASGSSAQWIARGMAALLLITAVQILVA